MSTARKRKRPEQEGDLEMPISVPRVNTYLNHVGLDINAPCTDWCETLTGAEPPNKRHRCWLLGRVEVYNRILEHVGVETLQDRCGKLSVYTFAPMCDPSLTDYGTMCAMLLGDLLAMHRCIYYLHCGYSGCLFALNTGIFNYLAPTAALEQFHINGRMMTREESNGLIRVMLRGQLVNINISCLQLHPCAVTRLSHYIESTMSLKDVSLSKVGLRVADMVALFKAFESSNTVEVIELELGTLGIRGAQQFAKLLRHNKTLRSATLHKLRINAKGAMAIASALAENITLHALRIPSNCIGPTGTRALADALKMNNSLVYLDLRDNAIGTEGAYAIAEMLAVNAMLEELHMCVNGIFDNGIVAVADSLRRNKKLRVLSVYGNPFRDAGVAALARLLAGNDTLQRLNATLETTYGDGSSLGSFTDALAANKTLCEVQLFVWGLNATQQLSHTLRFTETLRHLSVCMYSPAFQRLCTALEANRSIQEVEINSYLSTADGAALGHLFQVTTTIRAVNVSTKVNTLCLIRMLNGLAKNKSIWWFSVQCARLRMSACNALAGTLEVNSTLCCMDFGRPAIEAAGLLAINEALVSNPIIQVMGLGYTAYEMSGLCIRERLRSNTHRMMEAIEFVLNLTVCKSGAEAFEAHKKSMLFQRELDKAAESRGRPSALAMIRDAELLIEDNYFRITGVVKNKIMCVRPACKRNNVTMFDHLNKYCLKEVLKYLRVCDVQV